MWPTSMTYLYPSPPAIVGSQPLLQQRSGVSSSLTSMVGRELMEQGNFQVVRQMSTPTSPLNQTVQALSNLGNNLGGTLVPCNPSTVTPQAIPNATNPNPVLAALAAPFAWLNGLLPFASVAQQQQAVCAVSTVKGGPTSQVLAKDDDNNSPTTPSVASRVAAKPRLSLLA